MYCRKQYVSYIMRLIQYIGEEKIDFNNPSLSEILGGFSHLYN